MEQTTLDKKAHSTSNTLWKETLLYFLEFINIVQHKNTQTLLEPLWYYDKIQIQNVSVFLPKICMKRDFT